MSRLGRQKRSISAAAGAGLLVGLAGTIAMSQFQKVWRSAARRSDRASSSQISNPTDIAACIKIADRLASLGCFSIPDRRLRFYGLAMHYTVGAGAGLTYGLIREIWGSPPRVTLGSILAGAGFGTALFVAADKAITPALGFKQGSLMGTQAYGLSSHVVYGAVVAATWDQIRASL